MPDINGVQVTIVSNDKPLEEYEVTYEGDTATCWIPSEAGEVRTVTQILPLSVDRPRSSFGRGSSARWRSTDDTRWFQTFEIRWRVHPGLPLHNVHRVFDCYMDGRGMKRALGKPSHRSGSVLGVSTGATTLRPFTFSTVQLTGTSNFRPIRFFFFVANDRRCYRGRRRAIIESLRGSIPPGHNHRQSPSRKSLVHPTLYRQTPNVSFRTPRRQRKVQEGSFALYKVRTPVRPNSRGTALAHLPPA